MHLRSLSESLNRCDSRSFPCSTSPMSCATSNFSDRCSRVPGPAKTFSISASNCTSSGPPLPSVFSRENKSKIKTIGMIILADAANDLYTSTCDHHYASVQQWLAKIACDKIILKILIFWYFDCIVPSAIGRDFWNLNNFLCIYLLHVTSCSFYTNLCFWSVCICEQ